VICDELLPVLYQEYNISKDPEQHAIGGASSGAIAAFSVAWERPDQFRKVISMVGSFVNLRGGHIYPERVLDSARKPIRISFQDGRNDNRGVSRDGTYDPKRDWFLQNVRLVDALTKKGYDVNYVWGIGLHGTKQGGAILPEMMRWLWRDHPVSVDVRDHVERAFQGPAGKSGGGIRDQGNVSLTLTNMVITNNRATAAEADRHCGRPACRTPCVVEATQGNALPHASDQTQDHLCAVR
jgi:enterochelin esterase family protein